MHKIHELIKCKHAKSYPIRIFLFKFKIKNHKQIKNHFNKDQNF